MDHDIQKTKKIIALSPLADPVVNAMFSSKETAGLAITSLINAVLEEDGELIQIERIISVTPPRHHSNVKQRGCRIDVEVATTNKERVIVEVQMKPETWIMKRNLFAASRIFTETSKSGDNSKEMAERLPRIIVINIVNFLVRDDNDELIQPVKMIFTKRPQRVAVDNLKVHNVQLPRIKDIKEDFSKPWYCWVYAMHKADSEKKTIGEVVAMTPQLQAYSERDAGFRQYCEQYGRVASDPETRHEYLLWYEGLIQEAGERHAAEEIARQEEREKWQDVVAKKDVVLAEKDTALAEKDALIAKLQAKLNENK
jgi:predicted transposase/invertase (TIGR01784 family)